MLHGCFPLSVLSFSLLQRTSSAGAWDDMDFKETLHIHSSTHCWCRRKHGSHWRADYNVLVQEAWAFKRSTKRLLDRKKGRPLGKVMQKRFGVPEPDVLREFSAKWPQLSPLTLPTLWFLFYILSSVSTYFSSSSAEISWFFVWLIAHLLVF